MIDVALAQDGELFLATISGVYMPSPYGYGGVWQSVPPSGAATNSETNIRDLAVLNGVTDSILIIVEDSGPRLGSWGFSEAPDHPWQVFRPALETEPLVVPPFQSVRRVHSLGVDADGTTRAWVEVEAAGLATLMLAQGNWPLASHPDWPKPSKDSECTAAYEPAWEAAVGWTCGNSEVFVLADSDVRALAADLALIMVTEPEVQMQVDIRSLWVDPDRELVFIGTKHGLAVVDWRPDGDSQVLNLRPVPALGRATILDLGITAGRLRVTVDNPGLHDLAAPVLFEQSLDAEGSSAEAVATHRFFEALSGGPRSLTAATPLADDLMVVTTDDGLWGWAPGRWRRVPGHDTSLLGGTPQGLMSRLGVPPVFFSLLGDRLFARTPSPADGWLVYRSAQGGSIERLLPDPSGRSV